MRHPERKWGYPTQKPCFLADILIRVHVPPGEHLVVDPFCGSSSTGEAALRNGHRYVGFDTSVAAVELSKRRCAEVLTEMESGTS